MKMFGKNYRIPAILIITILLVVLLIILFIIYWIIDDSNKWDGFASSLAAGLVIAIIQLLIAWSDYARNIELSKLELIEILYNRDSRTKYESYINESKSKIDVMGVTAARFFAHFADLDENAFQGAKTLIFALERGVHVRVLLPLDRYISTEKKNAAKVVFEKYKALANRYEKLEIRYFDHLPAHSIFRIDDTCIVGPVFPKVESKYTPALHLKNTSPLAIKYINYFDSEWEAALKA